MKTDASVILPVTTVNETTYKYAFTTIKSCYDTTKAGIFVMDNNSHGSSWTEQLKKDCEAMGVRYEYFPQKFSTSKFFNIGRDRTHGKYIAYGSSDLVFHPNWLENIIELWEEQPEWWCLSTFQIGSRGMSCARDEHDRMEKRIVATHNVACGICVMKRADNYRWDERFVWQSDSDQVYHAEVNGLKMGYVCNARCDHILSVIKNNVDQSKNVEAPEKDENQLLKEKYGKRYAGC